MPDFDISKVKADTIYFPISTVYFGAALFTSQNITTEYESLLHQNPKVSFLC